MEAVHIAKNNRLIKFFEVSEEMVLTNVFQGNDNNSQQRKIKKKKSLGANEEMVYCLAYIIDYSYSASFLNLNTSTPCIIFMMYIPLFFIPVLANISLVPTSIHSLRSLFLHSSITC